MTRLLDGNLLVALVMETHVHHERAHRWFAASKKKDRFATCAVTQGTLLRLHMQTAQDRSAAAACAKNPDTGFLDLMALVAAKVKLK